MPFDISTFNASIAETGLLRDNRFEVTITAPIALRGSPFASRFLEEAGRAALTCEKVDLPGLTIMLNEVRRYGYGHPEPKPVSAKFTPANFIFRCGDDGAIFDFLHAWQQCAVNFEVRDGMNSVTGPGGLYPQELGYKQDYCVDIIVTAYAQNGDQAIRVVMRDAYPIHVGNIEMAWANKGNYLRVPAMFAYFDWYRDQSLFGGVNAPEF